MIAAIDNAMVERDKHKLVYMSNKEEALHWCAQQKTIGTVDGFFYDAEQVWIYPVERDAILRYVITRTIIGLDNMRYDFAARDPNGQIVYMTSDFYGMTAGRLLQSMLYRK